MELRSGLKQNGMKNIDIGNTYLADNTTQNGKIAESALDHIYMSSGMEEKTRGYKLENSATDHLPIVAEVTRMEGKNMRNKVVVKRSMKNFTKENWNRSLAKGEWEKIGQTEDVNVMAEVLNEQITIALDECAPMKEFKIRRNHRFGLKEETRKMMKERDSLRKKIGKSDEIRRK